MKQHIKYLFGLFMLTSLIFHSCSKEEGSNHAGLETEVFIRTAKLSEQTLSTLGAINRDNKLASNSPAKKSSEAEVQELVLPFSDDLSIVARLEPISTQINRGKLLANTNLSGTDVTKGLEPGTLYRVLVYDNSGAYVAHNDFTVGEETQEDSFKLTSGNTYTFVSYSTGSTTELPDLKDNINEVSLSEAALHEISSPRLMYQKQNVSIVGGRDNYVDITMDHQFSEITTIIRHKFTEGRIDGVSGAKISPSRENASLKFDNDNLTYSSATQEIDVKFGNIDGSTHEVISEPTYLISPETGNAEFKIESLTINGLSNPVVHDELNITPGVRYNLILEFDARCIKDTDEEYIIMDKNSGTKTFTLPEADYGFVFDIYDLDNSFDMEINGVHLLSGQKQTQTCPTIGRPSWDGTSWGNNTFIDVNFENSKDQSIAQNIRFKDGSRYGAGGIPEIFNLKGDVENPILRVVIEKDGSVSYYGSKESYGPLFPLEIITDVIEYDIPNCRTRTRKQRVRYIENQITWHANQQNIVKIFQAKIGATHLNATGYGQQKVSCADM